MPEQSARAWLGKAIRAVRQQRGWTQRDLADVLERSTTAVSLWEAGKRSPSLDEMLEIARILDVSITRLLPPQSLRPPDAPTLLRTAAERLGDNQLAQALHDIARETEEWDAPTPELVIAARTPAQAANELMDTAHVEGPPIAVDDLARRAGALIVRCLLPDSVSGLVVATGIHAVIGVNARHPTTRQRFTLAHELGHFVLGHLGQVGAEATDALHIDSAEGTDVGLDWRAERAAQDFAAELLMPRRILDREHSRDSSVRVLAARFDVSVLAMGYRLTNLGLR